MDKYKSAFLSYTKDAGNKAKQIANHLTGVSAFIFERDMDIKRNIKDIIDEIDDENRARDAVIIILSKKSLTSEWIYTEIDLALRYSKPIFGFKTSANLIIPENLKKGKVIFATKLRDLDYYFNITINPETYFDIAVITLKINDKLVRISDWLPNPEIEIPSGPHDEILYAKLI